MSGQDSIIKKYRKNLVYPNLGIIEEGELFFTLGLNYERYLFTCKFLNFDAKVSYNYWAAWSAGGKSFSIALNTIKSFKNHHIESCAGYIFITDSFGKDKPVYSNEPLLSLGYKYQKPGDWFVGKLYFATWSTINIALGFAF